jgi:hypothetical protein
MYNGDAVNKQLVSTGSQAHIYLVMKDVTHCEVCSCRSLPRDVLYQVYSGSLTINVGLSTGTCYCCVTLSSYVRLCSQSSKANGVM